MTNKKKTGEYYDKIPQLHEEGPSKLKEQISKGFGALLIIAFSIIFYFTFLRFTEIFHGFSFVVNLLTPVIYGLVIAYLVNPLMKKFEKFIYFLIGDDLENKKDMRTLIRAISVALSLLVFFFIIFILCYLVIPEVGDSIYSLVLILPDQVSAAFARISTMEISNTEIGSIIEEVALEAWTSAKIWIQTDLITQANSIMSNVTFGLVAAIDWVFDLIVGIILSIYVLMSKELFLGQAKKTIYAFIPTREANITLHILKKSNNIFGGFIIGKIIDSTLMGIITFIVLSIIQMPYTLLVSVIVGVTNVIPYFGPFIGAIPCAILILLQSPIQGIYFIIYIIILQQIDGNIIGPKILGDSTGLSPFWVIIAVILGSGLFGFVGMIIGVPLFAVFYYIAGLFINQKLERKKLPTDSRGYDKMSYVDETTGDFVSSQEYINRNQVNTVDDIDEEEEQEVMKEL